VLSAFSETHLLLSIPPVTDPTIIASIDSGWARKYDYEEDEDEDEVDEEMVVGYWRVVERD
jgi:hypothetical protein